ncbi:hypothetical protein PG985_007118 [Apiospora marii]|uniref:Uncharacterized protein n=1 Tax=Apiospora marii TaxID=335849 RepID=A0ABR1SF19_9PEZI
MADPVSNLIPGPPKNKSNHVVFEPPRSLEPTVVKYHRDLPPSFNAVTAAVPPEKAGSCSTAQASRTVTGMQPPGQTLDDSTFQSTVHPRIPSHLERNRPVWNQKGGHPKQCMAYTC